jgi:hypothetical protein
MTNCLEERNIFRIFAASLNSKTVQRQNGTGDYILPE